MRHIHFIPNESGLIENMGVPDLLYLPRRSFSDHRGFYAEIFRLPELETIIGRAFVPQQVNLSHSQQNVIRGIHAESWNKLLTVSRGAIFAAWVDVRKDAESFGTVVTMNLGAEDGYDGSVFVPKGVGNSFCVMAGPVDYLYVVDQLYKDRNTADDIAIHVFDKDLNIPWPKNPDEVIMSDRDANAVPFVTKFGEKLQ